MDPRDTRRARARLDADVLKCEVIAQRLTSEDKTHIFSRNAGSIIQMNATLILDFPFDDRNRVARLNVHRDLWLTTKRPNHSEANEDPAAPDQMQRALRPDVVVRQRAAGLERHARVDEALIFVRVFGPVHDLVADVLNRVAAITLHIQRDRAACTRGCGGARQALVRPRGRCAGNKRCGRSAIGGWRSGRRRNAPVRVLTKICMPPRASTKIRFLFAF